MTPQEKLKEIRKDITDPEYIHFENDMLWLLIRVEQLEWSLMNAFNTDPIDWRKNDSF